MRHQKKRHKLGRTAPHRKATLAAMATALIEHKRIETTLPKAKALRTFVEPLITRAKEDSTHNRREAFRHLRDKKAVSELFGEVASQVGDRPGGYTRVVRLGQRQGDAAEMAVIELVDWNDVKPEGASGARKKTRRGAGRGRRGKAATTSTTAQAPAKKAKKEEVAEPAVEQEEKAEPAAEQEEQQTEPAAEQEEQKAEPAAEQEERKAEPAAEQEQPAETPDEQGEAPEPAAEAPSTGTHSAPKTGTDPEVNNPSNKPQGADPGTGSPPPEAGKGTKGVAGGSKHRG